jgi:hypothetical protein
MYVLPESLNVPPILSGTVGSTVPNASGSSVSGFHLANADQFVTAIGVVDEKFKVVSAVWRSGGLRGRLVSLCSIPVVAVWACWLGGL